MIIAKNNHKDAFLRIKIVDVYSANLLAYFLSVVEVLLQSASLLRYKLLHFIIKTIIIVPTYDSFSEMRAVSCAYRDVISLKIDIEKQ